MKEVTARQVIRLNELIKTQVISQVAFEAFLSEFEKKEPGRSPSMHQCVEDQYDRWRDFYWEKFKITIPSIANSESLVKIPDDFQSKTRGFDCLVVVASGLTLGMVLDVFEEMGIHWVSKEWNSEDGPIEESSVDLRADHRNVRVSSQCYGVWIDEKSDFRSGHYGKSAAQLIAEDKTGPTLLEWMLYELKYHLEMGRPLPSSFSSELVLCAGTRDEKGQAPTVDHYNVYWGPFEEESDGDQVPWEVIA